MARPGIQAAAQVYDIGKPLVFQEQGHLAAANPVVAYHDDLLVRGTVLLLQ
jgi:hypothetical protein